MRSLYPHIPGPGDDEVASQFHAEHRKVCTMVGALFLLYGFVLDRQDYVPLGAMFLPCGHIYTESMEIMSPGLMPFNFSAN